MHTMHALTFSRMERRRLLIASSLVLVLLAAWAMIGRPLPGDGPVRDAVLARVSAPVLAFMHTVNHAGSWRVLFPAMVVLLLVVERARRRWWVWAGLMVAAPLAEGLLKRVIGRPRPEEASFGFPSGHATAAAAFFGAVIVLAASLPAAGRRTVRLLAVLAVVLVGVARIVLRAHWPSDVLGGVALGTLLVCVAVGLTGDGDPRPR